MDVTGKIALVTGGGRGIGRGIVLELGRNGADVVIADIVLEDAQNVTTEVEELGRRSMSIRVDVTDQGSVESMVVEALTRFGRIDILVNNAGVIGAPGWETRERPNDEDWEFVLDVNLRGMVRVTDAVTPHMKERRSGKILNITSVAGRQGSLTSAAYSASKAGGINLTQVTALDLAPYNINVNAICPGLIWTPMWVRIAQRRSLHEDDQTGLSRREIFDRMVRERTPLGREQTPEDIGNAVCFLASDYARNITGQALNVSGGSHMN